MKTPSFDEFVAGLGTFANQYTPEQLLQLHEDVKKFAEIVVP
jgi:hypothetical protein